MHAATSTSIIKNTFPQTTPDSLGGIVSLLLPELVECVVDGAADFVTDFSELLAEGERSSALIPVLVPLTPIQLVG